MTKIGLISMKILANAFVNLIFIVKFRVCEHGTTCALEVNNNS